MGLLHGDYHSADFPLFGINNIPWVTFNQKEKGLAAQASYPLYKRELAKLNIVPLAMQPYGEPAFYTTEDFPNILDVGGEKIRAQAVVYNYIVEAIGGTPVPIEWGEAYTALQTGVVKGIITGIDSTSTANIQEVAPYGHRIFMGSFMPWICVNKEAWESLPLDVQLIVTDEICRAMVTIQAHVPMIIETEVAWQLENGLEKWYAQPPEGWFDLMAEKVTIPMLEAELEKAGPVGMELVEAIEEVLGREVI
jgi:TRAP-type C4-dicarboxylate transport system substrate-binding protein